MEKVQPKPEQSTTVDPDEIAKFEAMAAEWWDPSGPMKPLHSLNPCRLDYLAGQIAAEFARDPTSLRPFEGLQLVDIGCGGGLLSEPMARLGASVIGVDAASQNIAVAKVHAAQSDLTIDYRHSTAEDLVAEGERFDVVLAMEVIEHVADPAAFVGACARLLRPGGLMLVSTINRTARSYGLAVIGAERILRWLPPGTHEWSKFVTPDELSAMIDGAGLRLVDRKGFVFRPAAWSWHLSERDLSVNYVTSSVKPASTT